MTITADQVTACLVTRGDVDLEPILDTLPYPNVIVWGADREELHVYGRYAAMREAATRVVYTQDDDCLFRDHHALLDAYQPGVLAAVYGHGPTPCGFGDIALVHGGALMDTGLAEAAFTRYLDRFPYDEEFEREADMISGCLAPHIQVTLPYEIRMDVATRPNRMCNQPWQREMKLRVTNRARWVRDHASGQPSRTVSEPVRALVAA